MGSFISGREVVVPVYPGKSNVVCVAFDQN